MKNKRFAVFICIALMFISVGTGLYYANKKTHTEVGANFVEYINNDIGISFVYPKDYGDVALSINQEYPEAQGPFNVKKADYKGKVYEGVSFYNLKYFTAYFSNYKELTFGGGIDCVECDAAMYTGDGVFEYLVQYPDQSDFEKFYTNSGEMGLLNRGQLTKEEACDDEEFGSCSSYVFKGDVSVTFQTNNDYRGVNFYAKDTPENIAILKSFTIKNN